MAKSPLYRLVYSDLLSGIQSGSFPAGTRLPTHKELAGHYGVSLSTLRQALGMLESQGLITCWPKRGTFVSQTPSTRVARDLEGFVDVSSAPITEGCTTVHLKSVTAGWVAEHLRLDSTEKITSVCRIRPFDGLPAMCMEHFLPQPPFPHDLEDSRDWVFFRTYLVQRHGMNPARYEAQLDVIRAGAAMARLLEVGGGEPLLRVLKTVFDVSGRPCEFVDIHVKPGIWRYVAHGSYQPREESEGGSASYQTIPARTVRRHRLADAN